MVRRYKRIQTLNKILSIAIFFSNVVNMKTYGKSIRKTKTHLKEKLNFGNLDTLIIFSLLIVSTILFFKRIFARIIFTSNSQ